MLDIQRYWLFVTVCVAISLLLMRLVLRQRITLQGSLSYLVFLAVLVGFALFPSTATLAAKGMGFTLLSNFFFAVTAGMFALLHMGGLVAQSKAELRTIALVQELAIMRERLDRLTAPVAASGSTSPLPEHPTSSRDAASPRA